MKYLGANANTFDIHIKMHSNSTSRISQSKPSNNLNILLEELSDVY